MPNRILREGIVTSPRIAKLDWPEEVFYRRLMSIVDDYGRYYADPGMLRAACYPRQLRKVADSDIEKWTRNLAKAALVRVYQGGAPDTDSYIELLDFRQQVRAKDSKFPQPPSTCAADATQPIANARLDVDVFGDVFVDVGVVESARARTPRAPLSEPTEEHRSLAATVGVDCQTEFVKFRDWLAANGRRQRDEGAGFRNWLRRAAEFKRPGSAAQASVHEKRAATAAAMFGKQEQSNGEPADITAESQRVA